MTIGSLFAGIGGFDLGLEQAGCGHALWQVDIDGLCRRVLARHWPDEARYGDIRTVGAHNLAPVDIITGGFPCQDLSVAGKRAGLEGGRSGLFYEMTRVVNEIRPTYVLWENVPGLLSSDGGRDFLRVLRELDRIGYHGAWRTLDSQYLGVAQRRRRVFGLFSLLDSGAERCAEILSLREGMCGHSAPRRQPGEGVAADAAPCLTGSGQGQDPVAAVWPADVAPTLNAHYGDKWGLENQHALHGAGLFVPVAHTLRADGCDASEDGTGRGTPLVPVAYDMTHGDDPMRPCGDIAPVLQQRMGTGGNQVPVVAFQQNASGEVRDGKVAYTLNQNSNASGRNTGMVQTGLAVRRLTPVECERLQGFPDGWTDSESDSARYRMLGNAVTVNAAQWIGQRLSQSL